jgi:hypothetical protein
LPRPVVKDAEIRLRADFSCALHRSAVDGHFSGRSAPLTSPLTSGCAVRVRTAAEPVWLTVQEPDAKASLSDKLGHFLLIGAEAPTRATMRAAARPKRFVELLICPVRYVASQYKS